MSARTYLLAAGAFAVGTSAYVVSGVLPAVSGELGVSLSAAGQLATAFALAYAVGAPLLATVTARWDRRTVLLAALVVAAVGNGLSALATTYPVLIAGRIIAALGAAAYTPAATLVATALLPPAQRARAVALVFGGLTLALAIGVPAGDLLGSSIGYAGVFAAVAVVSALVAAAVPFCLPRIAPPQAVPLRERFAVAADRRVLTVLAMTVIGVLSAMVVFIYVTPLLNATAGIHGATIALLLLVYGIGAMVGNTWGGRAADRFGTVPTLFAVLAGIGVTVAVLSLTASTVVGAAVVLALWGVFCWAFNPPVQSLLLELAPTGGLVLSLNASAIYLGTALAGVVGGTVIGMGGMLLLPLVAAALVLVVIVLLLSLQLGRRRTVAGTERVPARAGLATAE
ncbi:MFS transporter [Pseudonocardia alaniniphila]|uniref:MFS transporter n=1 Tax=Pseudonocardia alaniniphila TaxID=75291 RepID=A0ABS9THZ4_9PSEU|nr:MFS transporter [Pseudonocardia alaniniphila]MCH6168162.1 MFS transporter [Pseudonocardia alaniniphila]